MVAGGGQRCPFSPAIPLLDCQQPVPAGSRSPPPASHITKEHEGVWGTHVKRTMTESLERAALGPERGQDSVSLTPEKLTSQPFLSHVLGVVCCWIFQVHTFAVPSEFPGAMAACLGEPAWGGAVRVQKALALI